MGTVYLICFNEKFYHCKHYIGYTNGEVTDRFDKHKSGHGAKILKALNEKEIDYEVVRVWEDVDYDFERKLKNQKNSSRYCPKCKPKKRR